MNTGSTPSHRHTVGGKATSVVAAHTHTLPAVDAAVAALTARVVSLEADRHTHADPPPPVPPPVVNSVRVTAIPSLLTALEDDTLDEIIVADGTYQVSPASHKAANSLWISRRFASRTRPVLVRAETIGGVTFDGAKATYYGGITFNDGAHDQTWRGFRWINGEPTGTGVIVIGGYQNLQPTRNIVLEDCEVSGFYGRNTGTQGHGIYIGAAAGAPHTGLVLDRFKVTDTATVCGGGIHFYHDAYDGEVNSLPGDMNAHDTKIRDAVLTGMDVGFYVWAKTIKGLLIEDCKIVNARSYGVRYEMGEDITFRRVVSTGSKSGGFAPTYYMPGGTQYRYPTIPERGVDNVPGPKLITFEDCSFQ